MAGGIQPGTTAWDADSRKLDVSLREVAKQLALELPTFDVSFRLSKQQKIDLAGEDCFGFSPDGGAWFLNGKMVAVFEAKKQGLSGNAQERWWDNAVTAKHINPHIVYHTFCSGPGCEYSGPLGRLERKAQLMLGDLYTFTLNESGHTDEEIYAAMHYILSGIEG